MRFDLHIHSDYSLDSRSEVTEIIAAAKARGLHGIAITDHNNVSGSLDAIRANATDLVIIPGAEYSTEKGHLLVYFLKEGLENIGLERDSSGRFKSSDIIEHAHRQEALVFIAHPCNSGPMKDTDILKKVDGIEAYNSRAAKWRNLTSNIDAMKHSLEMGLPFSAGSDAHFIDEIGSAFIELNIEDNSLDIIKKALCSRQGKIYGKTSSSLFRVKSDLIKNKKLKAAIRPRLILKLMYFFFKELGLRLGIGATPEEGIYSFIDERIERHDII